MSLSGGCGSIIFHTVIDMDETRLQTIPQLHAVLAGTLELRFCVPDSDEARYAHIVSVAQRFGYARLNRPDKGVVLRYLLATCGYSRAQLTRLLAALATAVVAENSSGSSNSLPPSCEKFWIEESFGTINAAL